MNYKEIDDEWVWGFWVCLYVVSVLYIIRIRSVLKYFVLKYDNERLGILNFVVEEINILFVWLWVGDKGICVFLIKK